jgi:hypothetical protein
MVSVISSIEVQDLFSRCPAGRPEASPSSWAHQAIPLVWVLLCGGGAAGAAASVHAPRAEPRLSSPAPLPIAEWQGSSDM